MQKKVPREKKRRAKDFFGILKTWKQSTKEVKEEMRKGWN